MDDLHHRHTLIISPGKESLWKVFNDIDTVGEVAGNDRFAGVISESDTFVEVEEDLAAADEQEEKFNKMGEALCLLGEPCKTLLEDFYIQDLSMQTITEKLGYTNADNTKNQKYKCLMRLKKLFFGIYKAEIAGP